jgi:ABC transporter substrate binding protein
MHFHQWRRREFVTLLGGSAIALTFSPAASAQGRQARIGLLMPVSPPAAYLSAFREGLRERGYVEGQNLSIHVRWPPGPFEQNSGVVAELVRANVDVIVAWSTPALMAAGKATSTIPIVGVSISDLVGTGFVASLARPGRNVTGVTPINPTGVHRPHGRHHRRLRRNYPRGIVEVQCRLGLFRTTDDFRRQRQAISGDRGGAEPAGAVQAHPHTGTQRAADFGRALCFRVVTGSGVSAFARRNLLQCMSRLSPEQMFDLSPQSAPKRTFDQAALI